MNESKTQSKQRARLEKKLDDALEELRITREAKGEAVKELADFEARHGVEGDEE